MSQNPFLNKDTASAYKSTDAVYERSADKVCESCGDLLKQAKNILDIGAGTGISTARLLDALGETNAKLTVAEPSPEMLKQAKDNLPETLNFVQTTVEELKSKVESQFDLVFALNCFHLFEQPQLALEQVASVLNKRGHLVFNISSPSVIFQDISYEELRSISTNLDFYMQIFELAGSNNPILAQTVYLLGQILQIQLKQMESQKSVHFELNNVYNQDKFELLADSAKMKLVSYQETCVEIESEYQRNIWRMMAASFVKDTEAVEKVIRSIDLDETVSIKQAIVTLCKK